MFALVGGENIIGLDIICRLRPDEKEKTRELTSLISFMGISLSVGKRELLTETGIKMAELKPIKAYAATSLAIGKNCRLQAN